MDRRWFILNCGASLADHLLKGMDNFPDNVFDMGKFSSTSAVLEITESNTRGQSYVVYPRESEKKVPAAIRAPESVKEIVSPNGKGILFRANDQNYHVFSSYNEGFAFGKITYTDV